MGYDLFVEIYAMRMKIIIGAVLGCLLVLIGMVVGHAYCWPAKDHEHE
jgi:hypothetical protein